MGIKQILRSITNVLPDEIFLRLEFFRRTGQVLNLKEPKSFNEKLQWLKLYDRKPEYTRMVDKYEVKQYIAEKIGEEYIIPTLGVWDRFEDIDFDALPNQFVLKTTHDSGGVVICRDKSRLDMQAAKEKLEQSLRRNYYFHGREWPYKDVKPRILAEAYMQDGEKLWLPVYKVFNFNGQPRIIQAIQNDKTKDETIDYFDTQWNRLVMRQNFPNSAVPLERPEQLEQMLTLAQTLSEGFSFLRTDWYVINGRLYFSEFTFFSDCGFVGFEPKDWDDTLGRWMQLPQKQPKR